MRNSQTFWIVGIMLLVAVMPLPEQVVRGFEIRWADLYLLGVATLLLVSWQIRQRPVDVPAIPLAGALLLLAGYGLGMAVSPMPETATLGALQRLAAIALVLPVYMLASEAWGRRQIARLATVTSIALLTGTIYVALRTHPFTMPPTGVVDHANVLAYLNVVLISLAWQTARRDPDHRWRWWGIAATLASLLQVFAALSAGALLALAAAIIAGSPRIHIRWQRNLILVLAVGCAAALAVILLVLGQEIAVNGRLTLIRAGLIAGMEHPLTGQGVGSFLALLGPLRAEVMWNWPWICATAPLTHVHLEPLNSFVEGGVLSAVGLIALSLWAAFTALRPVADGEEVGWVRTLRRMTAALLVQGMITLAPTHEGVVVLVLAYGLLLARPLAQQRIQLPLALTGVLLLLLLAGLPLQVRSVAAQVAYSKGRDLHSYSVKDMNDLRLSTELWPEAVEARALLSWGLARRGFAADSSATGRTSLLREALMQAEITERYAPEFHKLPLLRARLHLALGQQDSAMIALEEGRLLAHDPAWKQLHAQLEAELAPSE